MENKDIPSLLVEILDEEDISKLKFISKVEDAESRQILLRGFFHRKEIFDIIRPYYDPAWVAYDIFINKGKYEF